jgi:hypothetical protein
LDEVKIIRQKCKTSTPTSCGHGGNGGDGGNIHMIMTDRAKAYRDLFVLTSEPGSGGSGGFGGNKSHTGSCNNVTADGEHGRNGYPGQEGSVSVEYVESL